MTKAQRLQAIEIIRSEPQTHWLLSLRKRVSGVNIHDLAEFLTRGEAGGFLKYIDEGCGFRGWVIVGDWGQA